MRISEVVEHLTKIKESMGDIYVEVAVSHFQNDPNDPVREIYVHENVVILSADYN